MKSCRKIIFESICIKTRYNSYEPLNSANLMLCMLLGLHEINNLSAFLFPHQLPSYEIKLSPNNISVPLQSKTQLHYLNYSVRF